MKQYISIIVGLLAIAVFFVFGMPAYEELQSVRSLRKEMSSAALRAQEVVEKYTTLSATQGGLSPVDLQKISKLIPTEFNLADFGLYIARTAAKHGFVMNSLKQVSIGNKISNKQSLPYTPYDSELTINGSPSISITPFLQDLENSSPLTDVVSINANTVVSKSGSVVTYKIIIRTYSL